MEEYDISFICSNCDVEIIATDAYAGMDITCPECGVMLKVPIPGLAEGVILGEFELIHRVGMGGMGEVWKAKQETLNRIVALKILLPKLSGNELFVKRFLEEANMAGRLEHPNIITAYSAGCIANFHFLATSFVDGVELNTRLRIDNFIPEREALKIVKAVANALNYAWNEHRMIHRDVKPSNIMLDRHGIPRLMDFGISKIIDAETDINPEREICGTAEYISPEQADISGNIDFRTDIYSLGITTFHLISGMVPFRGKSITETLEMQKTTPFPARESFKSNISSQCYRLIEIMTEKDPEMRHSSWDYVISDINLVLEGKMPKGRIKKSNAARKYNTSPLDAKISMKIIRALPGKRSFKPHAVCDGIESQLQTEGKTAKTRHPLKAPPVLEPLSLRKNISQKKTLVAIIAAAILLVLMILWIVLDY